ncbi:MAG: permease [Peptococcaceae bacterium]|nr:permease [Peptococcaceae bacterium]
MITTIIILFLMFIVLFVIAYRKGDGSHLKGLKTGAHMFKGIIPLLLLAFLLSGLIEVAIPPELIQSWLGDQAGFKGIFISTLVGALIPGGPYVSFPIIAAIFNAGAGIGTAVALITGWALLGVGQLPFEAALVGPRFMITRLSLVFIVPPLAGLIAQALFG